MTMRIPTPRAMERTDGRRARLLLLVLVAACTGCASMFLHGGRMAKKNTSTAGALATWDVSACRGMADVPSRRQPAYGTSS